MNVEWRNWWINFAAKVAETVLLVAALWWIPTRLAGHWVLGGLAVAVCLIASGWFRERVVRWLVVHSGPPPPTTVGGCRSQAVGRDNMPPGA